MAELPYLENFAGVALTAHRMARSHLGLIYIGPNIHAKNQWCALKTVRPELLGTSPRLRDRFVREALTWCGLLAPCQSPYDPDRRQVHVRYQVLEQARVRFRPAVSRARLRRGPCLRDLLALPHEFATRLFWAQCIAAGLLALHTPDPDLLRPEPLAHGDLRPENVLILKNGRAVLAACALAKAFEGDAAALAVLDTLPAPSTRSSEEPPNPAAVAQEKATRCRPDPHPTGTDARNTRLPGSRALAGGHSQRSTCRPVRVRDPPLRAAGRPACARSAGATPFGGGLAAGHTERPPPSVTTGDR